MDFKKLRDFNLAILSKKAWQFIKFPNLLVSYLFKARYFPHTDFFHSNLGSSPSYVWHSIWSIRDFLADGCRFRVGDRVNISVWNDAWLPNDLNPRITSEIPAGLEDITLSQSLL